MDERIYWIWISKIKSIGIKKYNILMRKYESLENLWNANRIELIKIKGTGEKVVSDLLDSKYRTDLDKYLEYMIRNKIEIISINDKRYPERLREIYDPPLVIYAKGDIRNLNNINTIGMVGGRLCSEYGKKVALELSEFLSNKEINIISGLAKGIDTYAHTGCLKGKAKTIAVLGSGFKELYPKENMKLAKEIIKNGGLIISEYPLDEKPNKINFPARNRIISALSNKIVVIEAKKNSGSIITVEYALEQGKDIYVVPGNIDSDISKGSNELIKDGANILTKYEDLID